MFSWPVVSCSLHLCTNSCIFEQMESLCQGQISFDSRFFTGDILYYYYNTMQLITISVMISVTVSEDYSSVESTWLMIWRSWVWSLAGAEWEFSFPGLTFTPDSFWYPFHPCVTAVVYCNRFQFFCQKSRWQVTDKHTYTLDPTKSEWGDTAVLS